MTAARDAAGFARGVFHCAQASRRSARTTIAQGCAGLFTGLSRGPYAAFAPPDAAMKNAWQNGDACITLAASQRKQQ